MRVLRNRGAISDLLECLLFGEEMEGNPCYRRRLEKFHRALQFWSGMMYRFETASGGMERYKAT
jgi:hypothetical protein